MTFHRRAAERVHFDMSSMLNVSILTLRRGKCFLCLMIVGVDLGGTFEG